MFELLTQAWDAICYGFQQVSNFVSGVVGFVQWVFSCGHFVWDHYHDLYSMIPSNLMIVFSPLIGLAIAAFVLKFVGWVKHMIPFN